ncbi:hypothetical protein GN958_ATG06459 [Phytophthora infestans]|uniref:Uncharacterized protein n=1 Tax=Phytophthora infestans TaxID=4787 RepID=A0A8S9UTQ2_PHYIN|nr:hypothetical protein GN958_ATG06459 [Phytophthora infestans]
MPRHQPRYSEGSDEDLASAATRSNSDGESRDIAVHSKKKKRLRRHPTARDRAVTKRRKQLPHRLSSRRHNSFRRRNEESLNVQDSSVESEHEKGSPSSFASDSDASSQNSSDSETEGCDGGDIAPQDELVDVQDLDVTAFDSWDALESYLKAYSRKTFQVCAA